MGEPSTLEPKRHRRIPAWAILAIGAVITGAGLVWTSTLYDDRGEAVLDGPTATVLVALLGTTATILSLLLQSSRAAAHELKPNSGTSMRDQTNRIEAMMQTLILDVGGLRADARNDRQANAERFQGVESRLDRAIAKVDEHLTHARLTKD